MFRNLSPFPLGLLTVALLAFGLDAVAQSQPHGGSREVSVNRPSGPGDVYSRIPAKDELGRDQLSMFLAWNPDPVGNHDANLRAIHPTLAKVVRKAQADNPELHFVVGSGKRDQNVQRKAVVWGWSRTSDSPHRSGRAADLWPLDPEGRVSFDARTQNRIAAALKKAATELGVSIRWGGHFQGFRDMDRSHFELAQP